MPTRKDVKDKVALSRQIQDRNFLQPIGFNFQIQKSPAVSFLGNAVSIPGIELGVTEQPSYTRQIPLPGDMMQFEDLTLRFLVDENLENYIEVQNWMRGLGFPESLAEFNDLKNEAILGAMGKSTEDVYSDGTLQILSSNLIPKFQVVFRDLFPYSLSTVTFDATDTDIEYFTADVSFKYTLYQITDLSNNPL